MIRLGYVGINTLLPSPNKTFRLANYTEDKMLQVARSNLKSLSHILEWNKLKNIKVFRITSDLIPFGSHPLNSGIWQKELKKEFKEIGKFIKEEEMAVSMHPGQFTVLNTPDKENYKKALADLDYHSKVLESFGLDKSHRIIIHGGGTYGNKTESEAILIERIQNLPKEIKDRLALENNEKSFNAQDILEICQVAEVPAVFDLFHHQIFPSFKNRSEKDVIKIFELTWPRSERQKIHYSQAAPAKPKGAHSETLNPFVFSKFYEEIKDLDIDIILEVKDKEQSILKLRNYFPELR
ncbi:MAG: UV DNA damage repair endonuclease UvsE [Patescibacteria group bacterium]|nr:UV DNA damage repair endonuclease UvsE [Patescibacteria group bacterium]